MTDALIAFFGLMLVAYLSNPCMFIGHDRSSWAPGMGKRCRRCPK